MKHWLQKLLCILLALGLFFLVGCGTTQNNDATTVPTTNAEQALRSQYSQAAQHLSQAENFYATITNHKKITTGGYTFSETAVQEFSYLHYGTGYMLADLKETYTAGKHTVTINEHFDSGICAVNVENAGFIAELSWEEYIARFAPLQLINEELYGKVTASDINGLTVLTFTEAIAPETWVGIDPESVIDIVAQAVLNTDLRLTECRYTVTYRSGTAVIETTVTSTLNTDFVPTLQAFPDTTHFVQISHPDIPKLLEQATGYVLQASSVTSSVTEKIVCNATGLMRMQNTALDMYLDGNDLKARLQRASQFVDYTQGGATTNLDQVELFLDNRYTIDKGGETTSNSAIDATYMLTYCQDTLVFPILLPKHITGMTVTEEEDRWVLAFDTTRELSDVICANVCQALYENPDILNDMASSYEVNYTSGYLVIDKSTGLPLEASLRYSGTHTIAGYAYELRYELIQSYDLTSQSAQDAFANLPENVPSTPDTTTAA